MKHIVDTSEWLFKEATPEPSFDGVTFDPEIDGDRLNNALGRVFRLMRDGEWRTLKQIAEQCGTSEAGASARLRDLRKDKFSGLGVKAVDSHRVDGGLWEYRVRV